MTETLWFVAGLVGGCVLGGVVAWLLASARSAARTSLLLQETLRSAEAKAVEANARLDEIATARDELAAQLVSERTARQTAESAVARLETRVEADGRNLAEQKLQFEQARSQLEHVFRSIGVDALRSTQEQFLEAAKATLAGQRDVAAGELEAKRQAIDASLKPVRELLERQQQAIAELERSRVGAYSAIEQQIKGLLAAAEAMRSETGKLSTALRRSDARGRWGEVALRNLVEMAGMTEHVDFEMQVQVRAGDAAQRPDLVVRLPGGGSIVVDAKAPLEHYLAALERPDEREALFAEHANAVKRHVDALGTKRYFEQFPKSPAYVVMFVPVESALSAALGARPDLQEYALRNRVVLASSGIFLGLLQTIGLFWRQEQLAENAEEIRKAGETLYDRLATFAEHFAGVGKALGGAAKSYNSAIASLESRVLPAARTLRELKATTKDAIPSPNLVEVELRDVQSAELRLPSSPEGA